MSLVYSQDRVSQRLRIVLLPGMDGTGALFVRFVACAPPGFECIPLPLPLEARRYNQFADWVGKRLPGDSPYILLAESFSGPIATTVAAAPSPNLRALVLCNSFVAPPRSSLWKLVPWELVFHLAPPAAVVRRYLVGRDAPADLVAEVQRTLPRVPARVLAARLRLLFSKPERQRLRDCTVPVLYLRGTGDRLVSESAFREIRRQLPSVARHDIEGPHLLLQASPVASWNAVQEFVDTLGAA